MSSTWLRLAEEIRPLPALYLTAGRPPAASFVAHFVDAAQSPSPLTRVDCVLDRVLRLDGRGPALAELLPNLVCGGLLTSRSRLPVDPRLTQPARAARAADLVAAAELAARRLGARSLAWLMVDAGDEVLTAVLDSAGYRGYANGERAVLDVRWSSFDGYLGSLRPSWRSSVRREMRALDRAGVTISSVPLTAELVPDLARLELDVLRRHGSHREPAMVERSLRLLTERLGGSALLTLARLAGRPCGFLLLLPWRDELHARNVGLDYAVQGRLPLYFGTCFYHPIRLAVARGLRAIDYAGGSTAAKAARGCRLVPQRLYVKGLERELQAMLDGLAARGGGA